jgi:hypothetical protein
MSKYERQMRMQQAAIDVLRRDPSLLSDERLVSRLGTIAGQTFGEPYGRCVELWGNLLRRGDVSGLSHVVLEDTEMGGYMRTVSPLGVLLTPEQRRAVACWGHADSDA